eukprot:scaffold109468_cov20-Tisochrysis_lutea.AAC.1
METLLHDGTPYLQEDINMRYVGIAEADYEWVTDQIMQVANRCVYERVCVYVCARVLAHVCCQGRVVSVLEGGYNLQGSIVSPFARSVAAHVRAMGEAHTQEWDPREAEVCLLARAPSFVCTAHEQFLLPVVWNSTRCMGKITVLPACSGRPSSF